MTKDCDSGNLSGGALTSVGGTPSPFTAFHAAAQSPSLTEQVPLHICAWCTPRAELDRLNARYPALSHGMCDACALKFEEGA
jgi:hypothetical protein